MAQRLCPSSSRKLRTFFKSQKNFHNGQMTGFKGILTRRIWVAWFKRQQDQTLANGAHLCNKILLRTLYFWFTAYINQFIILVSLWWGKKWILLPKLWEKNCSSSWEKLLKFEAEWREFGKFLRSQKLPEVAWILNFQQELVHTLSLEMMHISNLFQ